MTFRKKVYQTIDELQADLDQWIDRYNNQRTIREKCVAEEHPSKL